MVLSSIISPIYIEHKYTIKGYTLENIEKTNTLLCENTLPNVWVRNTRIRDLGILLTSPTGNQFSPANAQSTHPTNLWISPSVLSKSNHRQKKFGNHISFYFKRYEQSAGPGMVMRLPFRISCWGVKNLLLRP